MVLIGDVREPISVLRAISQADVVINASSYIGSNADMADSVNYEGTLSIIRACKSSKVRRLVQVSTTAVYGSGPHRALSTWNARYSPESAISRSRAAADKAVLSAGGIVIRPNLVHGVGDRWFIPGVMQMFKTLGTTIDDGHALLSMIDVTDLGLLAAAVALDSAVAPGAYHAAGKAPVALSRLLRTIDEHITPLKITGTSTIDDATQVLTPAGFSLHQVHMLGIDHHYESHTLWDLTGIPSASFQISSEAQTWYRSRAAQ